MLLAALLNSFGLGHADEQNDEQIRTLPRSERPVKVHIGFHVSNITDISEKEETIDFEGEIYLMWMDPRQAYDPAELGLSKEDFVPGDYARAPPRIYQGDLAVNELFEGWRPHIKLANGIADRQKTYMAVGVWPDGMMAYADHFNAKIESPMSLRSFPFDHQTLKVYLRPYAYQEDEVILVHERWMSGTWQQDSGIAEWTKLGLEIEQDTLEYLHLDGEHKERYSQLVVSINVARRPGHILITIIFPLLLLVSLTWCIFWMDEESISNRVSVSFVGILSVVAYYFVVLDSVPEIPYLTMMDAFLVATFLLLALSVVISFVVDRLNRTGRKRVGDRVDHLCRWLFPLGYAGVIGFIVLVFL